MIFLPERLYRMPVVFGPSAGPRQTPEGGRYACKDSPRETSVSLSFLTEAEYLQALLPPGFELDGEPVVTIFLSYYTDIEWLAGRGYNVLGVMYPASFRGKQDAARGNFLAVLWENMADPIITGREELGMAKIFCNLEPLDRQGSKVISRASWEGFTFMELQLDVSDEEEPIESMNSSKAPDLLHYKYMPRTGQWGSTDTAYVTLTPSAATNRKITQCRKGTASLVINRAQWADMPTQYHIVNALESLPKLETYTGYYIEALGGSDISQQKILK